MYFKVRSGTNGLKVQSRGKRYLGASKCVPVIAIIYTYEISDYPRLKVLKI